MSEITFHKYHGNGNDFIIIDNRKGILDGTETDWFHRLCQRRFGVGADGVILLNSNERYDFEMKYYNADGRESTMCGNGGRCVVKFAKSLGLINDKTEFLAVDGVHEGIIEPNGRVRLKMQDIKGIESHDADFVVDTGSPHFIRFVDDLQQVDVFKSGRTIRNQPEFIQEGINVNFIETNGDILNVRTYERGVEEETYSCGTGIVAAALIGSVILHKPSGDYQFQLQSQGGPFEVAFKKGVDNTFTDVWLIGGATFIFEGKVNSSL